MNLTDIISKNNVLDKVVIKQLFTYILFMIIHKLIEFFNKLKNEDPIIISLLNKCIRDNEMNDDLNIYECIETCEIFIMDVITNILQEHFDSKWIISNMNKNILYKKLSKQKEREKQLIIQRLDNMSSDKRLLTMELQKSGINNFFKSSEIAHTEYTQSESYSIDTDKERYEIINFIYQDTTTAEDSLNISSSIDISPQGLPSLIDGNEGYFNENSFDEDGQLGDELHEFYDENILDIP
jgi:hypothetical protein